MSQTIAEKAADTISETAHKASRATDAIADAFNDGLGIVQHAAKESFDAAEEFLNDTTKRAQRHIGLTVAITFAAGALVGAITGWTLRRK